MLKSYFQIGKVEAGCDEAGRGCLAGPVVAAAAIMPADYFHSVLTDSKKLSAKQREAMRDEVIKDAIAWAIGEASAREIEEINILNASYLAMHRAVKKLETEPELLLIDGNRFKPYPNIPHECIIKGDGKYYSIAAASILAKTHRDHLMHDLAQKHPEYGWATNAGYPTVAHRKAIQEFGTTEHHRQTFKLLPEQLTLFK